MVKKRIYLLWIYISGFIEHLSKTQYKVKYN
jgi:hypothetical protein